MDLTPTFSIGTLFQPHIVPHNQQVLPLLAAIGSPRLYRLVEWATHTTATAVFEDSRIPGVVKSLVNDSPVLVDLLYVLGSKAEDLEDFISTAHSNPSAAVRKLVLIEKLVMEELAKGAPDAETERGEDGNGKSN